MGRSYTVLSKHHTNDSSIQGFYDPVGERMFEPDLTGISYSFTADGHYEEAYYRAVPNRAFSLSIPIHSPQELPLLSSHLLDSTDVITKHTERSFFTHPATDPACPQGIMQWQHGSYVKSSNGSITLTPIAVDGRQLLSDPCNNANAVFTRYKQPEFFKSYQVLTDPYSKAQRLNIFAFDGSPLNPMYLAYQPPQMLPTVTLNPTKTSSGAPAATATGGSTKLRKRYHGGDEHIVEEPEDGKGAVGEKLMGNLDRKKGSAIDADRLWWIGVGMTALGGVAYYSF